MLERRLGRVWLACLFVGALTAIGCGAPVGTGDGGDADPGDVVSTGDSVGGGDSFVTPDTPILPDGGMAYSEPVCANPLASLSDLSAAYVNTAAGVRAAAAGIADRRYPIGRLFIDNQSDMNLLAWYSRRNTFADILNNFEVAVHEGQHIWDIGMIAGGMWPYRLRDDLVIRARRLTNFNRSEILTVHTFAAMDMYAPVYLMGGSGAQGFNTLLDEYSAYVHSLAARYCTRDGLAMGTRISARDGILTMMYYVEMYLRLARTVHPADYAAILADPEHIRLILTVWARAEFWLNLSTPFPSLGLRDATIRPVTYDPANVAEIDMLRGR